MITSATENEGPAPADDANRPLRSRWNLGVLGATTIVQLVGGMVMQSIALMGPILSGQLALDPFQFGLVVSSVTLGSSAALPFGWAAGNRLGTRHLLILAALFAGIFIAGAGLAWSGLAVGVLLLAGGFSWGLSIPAGGGAMATAAPPAHRGLFASVRQLALPAGGVAASVAAPLILAPFGWRGVLLAEGILFAATGLVVARSELPARERSRGRRRPAPAVLALGMAGMVAASVQWAFVAYLTIDLTTRLREGFGLAAAVFLVSQIGGALGRLAVGWASDRLGPGRTGALAATSLGGALSLLAFSALVPQAPPALVFVVCALNGCLAMGWNGILIAAFAEAGPVADAALNIATGQSIFRVGSLAAPPLFGLALSTQIGSAHLWPVLAGLSVLAAVGFTVAGRIFAPLHPSWLLVGQASPLPAG